MLTDAAPPRSRAALYDASHHRPRFADVTDEAANQRAVESYEAHERWLSDAWRTPSGQMQQPPVNGNGDGDDEDDNDPDAVAEAARQAYIDRVSNAWRTPVGKAAASRAIAGPSGATAVEAQRRRWNAESAAKDAALADRDVAYNEYIHRLTTAWKRP
jgi:hypothetical protein